MNKTMEVNETTKMNESMEMNETTEMNQTIEMDKTNEITQTIDNMINPRKVFSRVGLGFFIGSLVIYALQIVLGRLLVQWKPEWIMNMNINLMISAAIMYFIGMPTMFLIVKKIPAVKLPKRKMPVGKFLLALVMCFPIMYCSNIIGLITTWIIGLFKGSGVDNQLQTVVSDTNMLVILLYMVICAPIMEELIFRKLIIDRTVRYGQSVAIVLSGVMFGLFHGNLNQFVYAVALGMFFGFLYVKTGNIKVTIGLHMAMNFVGGFVSNFFMKAVRYEELEALLNQGNPQALMQFYMDNLPAYLAFMIYAFLLVALMIAGIVLLIVFRKRFVVEQGENVIPKGKRFFTIFINLGMILFCLFWIAMIVMQLFGIG